MKRAIKVILFWRHDGRHKMKKKSRFKVSSDARELIIGYVYAPAPTPVNG